MNNKIFNFYSFILLLFFGLISCEKTCEKDYNFYGDHKLQFKLKDRRTGQNLLEIGVNRYDKDTVKIYDQNLRPLTTIVSNNGDVLFNFLPRDYSVPDGHIEEPLNSPIYHTFYLYLEQGDYDTLRMTYQIGHNPCKQRILTQWSTSYNDSLYFNFENGAPSIKSVSFLKE
jgi:hypothetical protein